MKNTRTRILIFAALAIVSVGLTATLTGARYPFPQKWNEFLQTLHDQMVGYNKAMPEERVYVQMDKPMYKPGDDVWFAAWIAEGTKLVASDQSDILHIELINPKGTVEKTYSLVGKDGRANGDFHLEEAAGGIYKIKAWTQWQKNHDNAPLFEKEFQVQKVVLPRLKMNLDFDRKAFGPGDEVVATLKLETNANQPLSSHACNIVAQLEGKELLRQAATTAADGEAKIEFKLPANLATNDGLLNVMIEYNGLTESISRAIPIVLNKIDLQFFPEGGDMVEALPGKVAFRALNEFGKPADMEGEVLDSRGKVVTTFTSFHQGMGALEFTPERGEHYTARITRPEGITQTYELPQALEKGFVLHVESIDKEEIKLNILSADMATVNLAAQVRGAMCWGSEVILRPGNNVVRVPAEKLPMGVAVFTLFDGKGIERAERLAFVNRDQKLNIKITTDKQKYLPREKVKMTVTATDASGYPMPASLALSVVNDQLISFADDKSGNIMSKMLFEYDIKEKVEEPAFYFDKKEEKAEAALDLVMLTSGWRRFTWAQVISGNKPQVRYQAERAEIAGMIYDGYSGNPISNAKIQGKGWGVSTNAQGQYKMRGLDLSEPQEYTVSASGYQKGTYTFTYYGQGQTAYLYPNQQQHWLGQEMLMEVEDAEMVPEAKPALAVNEPRRMDWDFKAMPNADRAENKRDRGQLAARKDADKGRMNMGNVVSKVEAEPMPPVPSPEIEKEIEQQKKKEQKNIEADFDQNGQGERAMNGAGVVADSIMVVGFLEEKSLFGNLRGANAEDFKVANGNTYYRAREFAAPRYDKHNEAEAPANGIRTDFRATLFWNPNLVLDRSGRAVVEFYTSDEITSFRTMVEGIGKDGSIGHGESQLFTQLPFSMDAKAPVEVALQDNMALPVILTNNTSGTLTGAFTVTAPNGLKVVKKLPATVSIPAGQTQTLFLEYQVTEATGKGNFEIAFNSQGRTDAFTKEIDLVPQGFPMGISFAGRDESRVYTINIENEVQGSIKASLTAYPSVVTDLLKGIESILQEPYGCFEQTSSSSYPNVLVMNYMKEMEIKDGKVMDRAKDLLERGYARLTSYETPQKGYEWFGAAPAHEGLSAFGLMQFSEMKDHSGKVDQQMIDRTAKWLMSRRDGKGAFNVSSRFLHTWLTDVDITSAYIVYALSESGYTDVKTELDAAVAKAKSTNDPYQLALVANALYNYKDANRAAGVMTQLMKTMGTDGSFDGKKFSIVCSQGQSLKVETTALALQAMIKSGKYNAEIQKAVDFIQKNRQGSGGFGNTQATVLALKSLTDYAKFAKKTDESGMIEIWVDGTKVGEATYEKGHREPIEIAGLEKYITGGTHNIEVRSPGVKNPLPWSVAVKYYTNKPQSAKECQLSLDTKLGSQKVKVGETVRLSAKLTNLHTDGVASPMAVIGIPAGLSAQPWQLKEMQEKGVFDYYEIVGNHVVCYYRDLSPSETREINFDLKAEISGNFEAPASSAYLYYTPEFKYWTALPSIQVNL